MSLQTVKILPCKCKHDFQDKEYGKTIDFTIVESLKDQKKKKIHMLIINVPYVPPQLQSLNKMDYLLYILFFTFYIFFFIHFIYTYYKINKIWKILNKIKQNEKELNYYRNKDNYDYINTNSGKINWEKKHDYRIYYSISRKRNNQ